MVAAAKGVRLRVFRLVFASLVACSAMQTPSFIAAQEEPSSPTEETQELRATLVERSATAINYRPRSGATTIDFRGTELMPEASGQARVESQKGYIEINATFRNMPPASKFGAEYLTYVMWAVTPEGRADNMGEIQLNKRRNGELLATTELQVFALVVTAEPYFAVTRVSDVVVLENQVREDTKGKPEEINATYELLKRGQYEEVANVLDLKVETNVPLELYQARYAVQFADATEAGRYATEPYAKAKASLERAESYLPEKPGAKVRGSERQELVRAAREAVQTAEDALGITAKRKKEEADRRAKDEAEKAAAQAKKEAEESARLAAERDEERQEAEAQAAIAMKAFERSVEEKTLLRERLLTALKRNLVTAHDPERGLVVNMSDVAEAGWFEVGQSTLNCQAREKLARLAGIVISYPDLTLAIEGHTDDTGTPEANQQLSEKRAEAVETYLVDQGVSSEKISATGWGETKPVAKGQSDEARRQNRRVEIVVSGKIIGTEVR